MRNSSMGPSWRINPITHHTISERSYLRATSRSSQIKEIVFVFFHTIYLHRICTKSVNPMYTITASARYIYINLFLCTYVILAIPCNMHHYLIVTYGCYFIHRLPALHDLLFILHIMEVKLLLGGRTFIRGVLCVKWIYLFSYLPQPVAYNWCIKGVHMFCLYTVA